MQFKIVSTEKAITHILAHSIKLKNLVLRKGIVLSQEHISMLIKHNINEVYVAIKESHDYSENLSAKLIAEHITQKKLFKIIVSNGRADIYAKINGVLKLNIRALLKINSDFQNIAVSTLQNYSFVTRGRLVGNVKILPYALNKKDILKITKNIYIKKIFNLSKKTVHKVAIIFTANDIKNTNKEKLLKAVNSRLEKFSLCVNLVFFCKHNHKSLSVELKKVLEKNIDLILIYGETSISDINDVVPRSIKDTKGKIISSIMPTDPGNLLLVGKINRKDIIGVPGCAKSIKRNGFDDILERVCHGEKFTRKKIAEIAAGGLYKTLVKQIEEDKKI